MAKVSTLKPKKIHERKSIVVCKLLKGRNFAKHVCDNMVDFRISDICIWLLSFYVLWDFLLAYLVTSGINLATLTYVLF